MMLNEYYANNMDYDDIVYLVFVAAAAGRVVLHGRGLLAACAIGDGSPPACDSTSASARRNCSGDGRS